MAYRKGELSKAMMVEIGRTRSRCPRIAAWDTPTAPCTSSAKSRRCVSAAIPSIAMASTGASFASQSAKTPRNSTVASVVTTTLPSSPGAQTRRSDLSAAERLRNGRCINCDD